MNTESKKDKELPLAWQLQSDCTKSQHFVSGEPLEVLTQLCKSLSSENLHDMEVNSENEPQHLKIGLGFCLGFFFFFFFPYVFQTRKSQ